MDKVKYIIEANCQLSDITNYKKLQNDPTLQHNKLINDSVNRFKKAKMLPENITDALTTISPSSHKCINKLL